ncbi:MAG: 16S rRNA (adenine(1518)-N(6)/adenine(1519)-N(6))-dimethyltransferase RsmA [Candidatus Hydrogenedentes bacterium]|nr:16S rRNA (adenine(1518)-N(6)/adenine(1519)-N(6))-dimethyltransferase RsmA [Candidatus Hydrogenedentota bacterium]
MALRDLVQQYRISFKKQLGQNLLLDENINRIMVEAAALSPEDDVIEVGAGLGALTANLAERAGRVLSIEIDRAFMPVLEDQFRDKPNVRLFRGDVLNHSLGKLVEEFLPGGSTYKMVSNLPYYITTPILFHFWEAPIQFDRLVVMVQEEVAERMTATVNSANYGALAIASAVHGETEIIHSVPRTCFRPQPNVDSCILRSKLHATPLYPDLEPKFIMKVVRAAFSQRRKTLRNSLTKTGAFGADKLVVEEAFVAAGIDPGRRPQTLSLDEFAALAREIRSRIKHTPSKDTETEHA